MSLQNSHIMIVSTQPKKGLICVQMRPFSFIMQIRESESHCVKHGGQRLSAACPQGTIAVGRETIDYETGFRGKVGLWNLSRGQGNLTCS